MYDLSIYDDAFFDQVDDEARRHAGWFVPLLYVVFGFESLMDVGCGTGRYLEWAADLLRLPPVYLRGLEGSPAAFKRSWRHVTKHDLRTPIRSRSAVKFFDLCISIEVAEHIEAEYADIFVDNLCACSDTICMTAAPPGQQGLQHVNEQPKEYWVGKFAQRGYRYDPHTTFQMKRGIAEARRRGEHVASWFEPNVMVFRKEG